MSQPAELTAPEQLSKLLRVAVVVGIAAIVALFGSAAGLYLAFNKKPVVIAANDAGRVIEAIPLNKPYVTDTRVTAFVEECGRRSFSHDFKNFRLTLNEAARCFTSQGSQKYMQAMDPMIGELIDRRMLMSTSMEPPVIVRGPLMLNGRVTWDVQSKMVLYREGQKERINPQSYVLEIRVVRVDLEESVRGIAVDGFVLRPANS